MLPGRYAIPMPSSLLDGCSTHATALLIQWAMMSRLEKTIAQPRHVRLLRYCEAMSYDETPLPIEVVDAGMELVMSAHTQLKQFLSGTRQSFKSSAVSAKLFQFQSAALLPPIAVAEGLERDRSLEHTFAQTTQDPEATPSMRKRLRRRKPSKDMYHGLQLQPKMLSTFLTLPAILHDGAEWQGLCLSR